MCIRDSIKVALCWQTLYCLFFIFWSNIFRPMAYLFLLQRENKYGMAKERGKARTTSTFLEMLETIYRREQTKLSRFFFFSSIVWINPSASWKTFYSDKLKKSLTDYSEYFHPEIATLSCKVSFSYLSHNDMSFWDTQA